MTKDKKNKLIEYWQTGSNLDYKSVQDIAQNSKSYLQALFFLHLSIEKALKALYVNISNDHAPFSHGLLYLSEKCSLELTKQQSELLADINEFNLETRYPDEHFELNKKATKDFTLKYVKDGGEIREWILKKLKN